MPVHDWIYHSRYFSVAANYSSLFAVVSKQECPCKIALCIVPVHDWIYHSRYFSVAANYSSLFAVVSKQECPCKIALCIVPVHDWIYHSRYFSVAANYSSLFAVVSKQECPCKIALCIVPVHDWIYHSRYFSVAANYSSLFAVVSKQECPCKIALCIVPVHDWIYHSRYFSVAANYSSLFAVVSKQECPCKIALCIVPVHDWIYHSRYFSVAANYSWRVENGYYVSFWCVTDCYLSLSNVACRAVIWSVMEGFISWVFFCKTLCSDCCFLSFTAIDWHMLLSDLRGFVFHSKIGNWMFVVLVLFLDLMQNFILFYLGTKVILVWNTVLVKFSLSVLIFLIQKFKTWVSAFIWFNLIHFSGF